MRNTWLALTARQAIRNGLQSFDEGEGAMKKFLLACAIAAALAATGILVNFQFAPLASYAQPAPAPP
jgi:hypothetical protein